MDRRERAGLVARAVGAAMVHASVVGPLVAGYAAAWGLLGTVLFGAVADWFVGVVHPALPVGFTLLGGLVVAGAALRRLAGRLRAALRTGREELLADVRPLTVDDVDPDGRVLADGGATPAGDAGAGDAGERVVAPVRRLAAAADVPVPELGLHPAETPLCYTVAHDGAATLVVSRGLLAALPDEELRAVLAHEVAHLANADHRLMTWATAPLVLVEGFSRWRADDGDDRLPDEQPLFEDRRHLLPWAALGAVFVAVVAGGLYAAGEPEMAAMALLGVGLVVGVVVVGTLVVVPAVTLVTVVVLTPVVVAVRWAYRAALAWATFGTGLFSRGRELAADRAAAALTGEPAALAAALERLDDALPERPPADLRERAHTRDALNVLPALDPRRDEGGLLGTHPATERRVARLRAMTRERERA